MPLAVVLSGANTHDIKLLEETLDSIMILRPRPSPEHPRNLCLDAGYIGTKGAVRKRSYILHIRPRCVKKIELERNTAFKALLGSGGLPFLDQPALQALDSI